MNTQTQEALKMAIKTAKTAIKEWQKLVDDLDGKAWRKINELEEKLEDCKEALEQPAQEPVAHIKQGMDGYPKLVFNGKFEYASISAKWDDIALYTNPAPSWQGLSDDEINKIVQTVSDDMYPWKGNMLIGKIIRAIEQALKEKNT